MDTVTSPFELILLVVGFIISVLMIIAILKIPKIASYHKATLKLTALMARKSGVDREQIEMVINEADHTILTEDGKRFEKQLSN